ncbi:acyl-CoA dehydrogenase [Halomicrococcus sp. NG-SE-24]|uniref:acyl-CoA dehydrogenase n=1 Tax=Halomicrococcus sp. NG-SE-24 TaxID=3436928 RepID=UPI003D989BB9
MTGSFKSGSGDLDFGGGDDDTDEPNETADPDQDQNDVEDEGGMDKTPSSREKSSKETSGDQAEQSRTTTGQQASTDSDNQSGSEPAGDSASEQYPYYVRRSKVGDERDKRIELHVRSQVASDEPSFRDQLANELDVDEVAKTDAREAALLFAFQNPEAVAELMRDEGYGVIG